MNIAPKAGRLATGAYTPESPIKGDRWGQRQDPNMLPAVVGGIRMPDDRTATVYGNPLSGSFNTATQPVLAPTTTNNMIIFHPDNVPEIGPHERGTFFKAKAFIPVEKTQFGASAEPSDTAFHRVPVVRNAPPIPQSAKAGERTSALSFTSRGNNWFDPNNSFLQGVAQAATGNKGVGRWGTVKRGVV
jgi:hypothetical protein